MKKYIWVLVVIVLIIVLAVVYFATRANAPVAVASFEECVAAGNPVMASFPRQCRSANGELFVEEVKDSQDGEDETLVISGAITKIDQSQVATDGPYLITLESESGARQTIAVPSFGFNLCPAKENIADISSLSKGQKIEVRGEKDISGKIVLCQNPEDYLKLATETKNTATLGVGETATVGGISITLNEVVQESRCPIDAECIEAGAITVNVTLSTTAESPATEIETKTFNMASDEAPHAFSASTVAITNIAPPLKSGETIRQLDYRITFAVKQK